MIELPEDVAMLLVRGVGAYLRAMPATELPPKLKRFRSFRPQSLGAHRAELLAVLEDDALRARITEWLEKEKPSLPKTEADALRIAAARKDGWQGELKSRAKPSKASDKRPAAPSPDRLEAEREKTRKAKDEARRAKEEARARVDEQRARISSLTEEVRELTRRVSESERAAAAGAKEAERTHERLEREARKARSDLEKAQTDRDRAKAELKEARREATSLRREVTTLKSEVAALKKKPESKPKKQTSARAPLPVPKGRLEDAPETLESWLGNGRVHLLIDGYNVAKAEGGFGDLPLEKQRDRLVQEANKLAHRVGGRTIVVFDGSKVPAGIARRSRGKAEVEFSRAGEIADDHIIVRLAELPAEPAILVTNDKELQRRGRKLGATIATSNQLLALIH